FMHAAWVAVNAAAQPRPAPKPPLQSHVPSQLPAAATLMAQFNAALGGQAAVDRIKSIHIVGTMTKGDIAGMFEQISMRPDRSITIGSESGASTMQGYGGTVAWVMDPMGGASYLTGAQAA